MGIAKLTPPFSCGLVLKPGVKCWDCLAASGGKKRLGIFTTARARPFHIDQVKLLRMHNSFYHVGMCDELATLNVRTQSKIMNMMKLGENV